MATSELQHAAHDDGAGAARTMCAAFQRTVADHGDVIALRTLGDAARLTWREYGERVRRLAGGLHSLGLRRGDTLALMLTNRPEFHLVDAAAMHLGVVPFSVYNTAAPEQIEFVVRDAGARVAVVEDGFRHRLHTDEVIGVEALANLEARGDGTDLDFNAAWRAVRPDDVLTLIYTSGTTGDPKGVQITHRNMVFTARAYGEVIGFPTNAAVVSYLPMAHIAERNCSHYFPMLHGFTVTCLPDARQVVAAFPEVRPAWFFAVPRIFEKLKAAIEADADQPLRDSIDRGLARLRGEDGPAPDERVLISLRERLGLDRLRALNVGAAPTPREVIEFFHAIGLPLAELYGMSETTAIGACNPATRIKIGTVGPPVPGVDMRLAADGEVEVRGDCVTPGYRGREDLTREAFTADGWLRSGDIGRFDEDGYLSIVDRKKELIINAAGKNMSPALIESELKTATPLIGSAVAIGDRRPYNVALIVLDADAAAAFARDAGLGHRSATDLAGEPKLLAEIEAGVERANRRLSNVEQIKRFKVLAAEWPAGGDELTPTMKLKRKPIHEKYASDIEELYVASRSR
ncbi:MAG: long-chain fatty acid--CoA ligase [Solirubrobacterales bacterium]|nr:long-chain fatty acid--CoA ligase [Solirubrobacterales bacterium]MBV9713870.1 long-chain fatty acid--CoA ligase [Solirubrobacterales bacterium]